MADTGYNAVIFHESMAGIKKSMQNKNGALKSLRNRVRTNEVYCMWYDQLLRFPFVGCPFAKTGAERDKPAAYCLRN